MKMRERAKCVIGLLAEPSTKQKSQESMESASLTIDDTSHNNFDRKKLEELRSYYSPLVVEELKRQV